MTSADGFRSDSITPFFSRAWADILSVVKCPSRESYPQEPPSPQQGRERGPMPQNKPGNGNAADRKLVLLTGATGYVGGRLIPAVEKSSAALRCLARSP